MVEGLTETFAEFFERYNIKNIISFSGGTEVDESRVDRILNESFEVLSEHNGIAILTGGTVWGLPGRASQLATKYKMPTIGVFPRRGEKDTDRYALSRVVITPPRYGDSEFGDETELFVKLSDGMIMIAGGYGTALEYFYAMKINDRRVRPKYGQRPIYIAPVYGLGGFSERAYDLVFNENLRQVLPEEPVNNGIEAAGFLVKKLKIAESNQIKTLNF